MKFIEFYNEVVNIALLDDVEEEVVERKMQTIRDLWGDGNYSASEVYELLFGYI